MICKGVLLEAALGQDVEERVAVEVKGQGTVKDFKAQNYLCHQAPIGSGCLIDINDDNKRVVLLIAIQHSIVTNISMEDEQCIVTNISMEDEQCIVTNISMEDEQCDEDETTTISQ